MQILEIYKKYKIMPQLAEHQFAVAAVADVICENFKIDIDRENIIKACLLHDMGNIAKFTFDEPSKYLIPESEQGRLEYWQQVKDEFIQKYGSGSHNVTMKIVGELGVSARIIELVDCVGFEQGVDNEATNDFGKKICAYSDMRVGPKGVFSLEERLADLRVRYKNHSEGTPERDSFEQALRQIEKQIFEHCSIKPEDITAHAVGERKEGLKSFEI